MYYINLNNMKVLWAIILGWMIFSFDLWEFLIEIGFYVVVGWLIIKAYSLVKESL